MTEQRNTLNNLFAACWKDPDLKARLMSDPKAVFAEHGIDIPEGITLNIVENTENSINILFPNPPEKSMELTDSELAAAAGGKISGDGDFITDHSCCFCHH